MGWFGVVMGHSYTADAKSFRWCIPQT